MKKTALTLETKSYFPTGLVANLSDPSLHHNRTARLGKAHGYIQPMEKPYRGVFGEKEELNRSRFCKCPGGTAHFWKKQLQERTEGRVGGWMPSCARRGNPRAKQGQWDYGGKQGLLARVEMGMVQPLVATLVYIKQIPSHRLCIWEDFKMMFSFLIFCGQERNYPPSNYLTDLRDMVIAKNTI